MSVLKFSTADGAEQALDTIQDLGKQHLITLHDAAIVTWPEGKTKPKTRQLASLAGMGALAGKFSDYGIDDNFIRSVQNRVTEGTSALFLMTSETVVDKVADAMKAFDFEIMATNLSREQEDNLRAAFA